MANILPLLETLIETAAQLDTKLTSQTFDFTPVLLCRIPSQRQSRRTDLSAALESLDAHWTRLELALDYIRRARERLKQQRSLCYSALSPISAMPHELLAHIFSYICASSSLAESSKNICCMSHVSKDWSVVALEKKALWGYSTITRLVDIGKVELPLQRCGEQDFASLIFAPKGDRRTPNPPDWMRTALREELIELKWCIPTPVNGFFDLLRKSRKTRIVMPKLQKLSIESGRNFYIEEDGGSQRNKYIDGDGFPALVQLSLAGVSFRSGHLQTLASLRKLYLSNQQIYEPHLNALGHLTQLETLDISNCRAGSVGAVQTRSPLLGLKHFALSGANSKHLVEMVLCSVELPQLEHFSLNLEYCEHGLDWASEHLDPHDLDLFLAQSELLVRKIYTLVSRARVPCCYRQIPI